MNWDDFMTAFDDARTTMRQGDSVANDMARMLVGRLRKCHTHELAQLKRELRDFNIRTRDWREPK